LYAGIAHGEGIAHYNVDLQGLNDDAALDAQGHLRALPLTSYYVGYTHFWTDCLRSTAVYSQVDLDSEASQGPFAYRHGQYASINLAYAFPKQNLQIGIEYLYGRKETFN